MSNLSFKNFRSKSNEILKFKCEIYVAKISKIILKRIVKTNLYKEISNTIFIDDIYIFIQKYLYQEFKPYLSKIFIIRYKKLEPKDFKISIKKEEIFLLLNNLYKKKINFINNDNRYLKYINQIKYFVNKYLVFRFSDKNNSNNKYIGVSYIEGFDYNRKNDLYWYDKKIFKNSEIIIYFQNNNLKYRHDKKFKGEAVNYFTKEGIKTVDLKIFQKIYNVEKIQQLKKILINHQSNSVYEIFLKKILQDFFKKIEYWYSFFYENNINIDITHLEIGTDIIAKKIAINLLNGCTVKKIRSYITENDPRLIGWYNENIVFAWGNDLAKRLQKTTNKPNSIIISGYYDNPKIIKNSHEFIKYTNSFEKNILILDNSWQENNEKDIENGSLQLIYEKDYINFYKKILDNFNNKKYGLIIKPKKYSLIKNSTKLEDYLLNLEKNGKCFIVKDAFQYPIDNLLKASHSIISIGIFFPTVLIESVIKKQNLNTYYYDYANLKNKEKNMYNYLFNEVFFNSLDKLLEKINTNLSENKNNSGIWENIIDSINAFSDKEGSTRIASYLKCLKYNLEKHNIEDAIKIANQKYSHKWGKDKSVLLK